MHNARIKTCRYAPFRSRLQLEVGPNHNGNDEVLRSDWSDQQQSWPEWQRQPIVWFGGHWLARPYRSNDVCGPFCIGTVENLYIRNGLIWNVTIDKMGWKLHFVARVLLARFLVVQDSLSEKQRFQNVAQPKLLNSITNFLSFDFQSFQCYNNFVWM